MSPNFFPASAIFLVFMTVSIPRVVCQDDQRFQSCSRHYECGNMAIGYPFWGGDRPEFCGYPGFELNCTGEAPVFTMEGASYRLLEINNSSNTFTVARGEYWDNNCPGEKVNTTLNLTLFSYNTSYPNYTIYYECSTLLSTPSQFNCSDDTISYYVTGNTSLATSTGSSKLTCKKNVRVPISQSAESAIETRGYKVALLADALKAGFGLEWNASNEECKGCVESGGQCGSDSNQFACYCGIGSTASTTCQSTTGSPPPGSDTNALRKVAIGVSAAMASSILLSVAMQCWFIRRRSSGTKFNLKKKSKDDKKVEEFLRHHGSLAPQRYSYWEIKKMTNSFTCKLGEGGYGSVYKGKLSDDRLVAVKVLSELKGNGEEFMNEIASICRTSHVNIVMLLGFCYEGAKRALIYEFMPNGSLDKFIREADSINLEWDTWYRIAVGIGRGLEYLHRGCNTRILHFDIKPHNILLDEDLCPKISDFGLAKLCQRKGSMVSMTHARGTIGYIAPEVFFKNFGGVSHKSDVYSYGMLVLDLVGGKENRGAARSSDEFFPDWIYKHLENDRVDLILGRVARQEEEETVRKMILVSLWCIQTNPKERPSIEKVVEMLEGSLQAIETPPKPFLFPPPTSPDQSSTTSLLEPSTQRFS